MLDSSDFKFIVQKTNLTAIDVVIKFEDTYLLGKRNNSPAKGFLFVPGGRIFKNETLKDGFQRIIKSELGLNKENLNFVPIGVFDHLYPTENTFEEEGFGTHYIIIAVQIELDKKSDIQLDSQHCDYQFMTKDEILKNDQVHSFTKAYFQTSSSNEFFRCS